ncbi:hypothetical protein LINGRAHAP2_LOCUS22523 [Linum grandiflorum]
MILILRRRRNRRPRLSCTPARSIIDRLRRGKDARAEFLRKATKDSDRSSVDIIRMTKYVFERLCADLVAEGGLRKVRNVEVDEMVVMFLWTVGHNIKNRILQKKFASVFMQLLLSGMARKKKEVQTEESGREYFTWTDELDQLLVNCMHTLVDLKKVDDKGKFVTDAYKDLERMMEAEMPGCGVKADPNILSRCKLLKKQFLAVQELKGLSGSGWDEVKKMVVMDDIVYAYYVAKHTHCAKLNRVPFPLYDGLDIVFGKGRATGSKVVGMEELRKPCPQIELPSNLMLGWTPGSANAEPTLDGKAPEEEANFVDLDDEVPPTTPSDRGNQSDATSQQKKRRRTSRAADNGDDDELKPLFKETVQTLKSLVEDSVNQKTQRAKLVQEIDKILGLTRAQAVKAGYLLAGDNQRMGVFFDLKWDEERKEWIEVVLEG